MTINKEDLLRKLTGFSENAHQYEEIGGMLINKCKNLYLKIVKLDASNQKELIKKKFEVDALSLALEKHKSGEEPAHGKLVSRFMYNISNYLFLVLISLYSVLYLAIQSYDFKDNPTGLIIVDYCKYFLLSIMGAMFYYITTTMAKYDEAFTKLLLACFIPILFLGVVFSYEKGAIGFSGIQSMVFLLGYNTNLMILFLRKANDKLKKTIEE